MANGIYIDVDGTKKSYTPVEYIESSGPQYIDTNISTNSNTKIEIEVEFNSATPQGFLWCGRDFSRWHWN